MLQAGQDELRELFDHGQRRVRAERLWIEAGDVPDEQVVRSCKVAQPGWSVEGFDTEPGDVGRTSAAPSLTPWTWSVILTR